MSAQPLYRKSCTTSVSRRGDGLIVYLPTLRHLTPALPVPPAAQRRERNQTIALQRPEPTHVEPSALDPWQTAYERGRQAWVKVGISYEEFTSHGRALGHREAPSHAVDLYLAAACRLGRNPAIAVLEQECIERTRSAIQHLVRDVWAVDDILQDVRRRVFVGAAPKIVCYRGTGPLSSWIRAIALNVARDYLRNGAARRRREETLGYSLRFGAGDTPLQDESLAHCILRQGRGAACLESVRSAFHSLQPSERQLLHDYYLKGFSIDVLAPLYHVNRATVARRIRRSADAVRWRVRKHLLELYPREDLRALDGIALAACRELMADAATLLSAPE